MQYGIIATVWLLVIAVIHAVIAAELPGTLGSVQMCNTEVGVRVAAQRREPTPPIRRGARAAAATTSQQGRIPRSAIVAILAAVRHNTPVRVVPVN